MPSDGEGTAFLPETPGRSPLPDLSSPALKWPTLRDCPSSRIAPIRGTDHYLSGSGRLTFSISNVICKEAGGEFRMSKKFGPYFLWPEALKV
jgi:hypothetical protein